MKKPPPTRKEKTLRAFRVYLELMETTAWLRTWMQGPLELFDLTPQGFRILVMLYEEGPARMVEVARRMQFRRPNLDRVLRRLEEHGWIRRLIVTLPKAERPRKRSKTRLLKRRRRWGIGVVTLTPEGERFIARAFPRQAKVLKALMRALHGREQQLLVEICRKLRAGAILKFMSEIVTVDEWDRDAYQEIDAADELLEDARANLLRTRVPSDADIAEQEREVENRNEEQIRKLQEEVRMLLPFSMDRMSANDQRHLQGIVAKMHKYDVLTSATHVDWRLPRDEAREAGHVLRMLRNLGNDHERELLERMRRGRSDLEVVEMLKRWSGHAHQRG